MTVPLTAPPQQDKDKMMADDDEETCALAAAPENEAQQQEIDEEQQQQAAEQRQATALLATHDESMDEAATPTATTTPEKDLETGGGQGNIKKIKEEKSDYCVSNTTTATSANHAMDITMTVPSAAIHTKDKEKEETSYALDEETGGGQAVSDADMTKGVAKQDTSTAATAIQQRSWWQRIHCLPLFFNKPPNEDDASSSSSCAPTNASSKTWIICCLIILIGAAAFGLILGFGITAANSEKKIQFDRVADDLLAQFQLAFNDYVLAGLWVQQATLNRNQTTHADFRLVYEYLNNSGLKLQAIASVRNVTHEERPYMENISRTYLQKAYPQMPYFGFYGLDFSEDFIEPIFEPRAPQPFYFPVRLIEPMEDPLARNSIDLDMFSLPTHVRAIQDATSNWRPSVTERLKLNPLEFGDDLYFVILMHPGFPSGVTQQEQPRDLGAASVPIKELIKRSHLNLTREEQVSLYIFDSTNDEPVFMGAARIEEDEPKFILERNVGSIDSLSGGKRHFRKDNLTLTTRQWTFVIVAESGSFESSIGFIVLGAITIFVACCGLAFWIFTNAQRSARLQNLQKQAEAEKTAMMVEGACEVARRERELNDFIAHEVRNPLSAAISACSFVSSAVQESNPLTTTASRKMVREDVGTIDKSLQFINDLLRSMLDVHRASSKQLKIDLVPTDVLRDVLEPVVALLYQRGESFEIQVDCPENLFVKTDRLRVKQIMLNLGRNAAKFVTTGFVRFRAAVINNSVCFFVEDSGPGIPLDKRDKLFEKFQESLDSLNQGTGIGLSLSKNLVDLLHGDLALDESYDSGVPDNPGTRFVINLNTKPISIDDSITGGGKEEETTRLLLNDESPTNEVALPETLSVLFVDDDLVLRKLFSRTIRKVSPDWNVDEAASGEAALKVVSDKSFDIIFLDQYMSSTEKQLLGTETARELRARGCESVICGLSANDIEQAFLEAGADCFCMKPFPCKKDDVTRELQRILNTTKQHK